MRVGLFFGSFNPIHVGHLMLAQYMVNFAGVDEVWLVVSPQNPFKQDVELADTQHRLNMARLAVGDNEKIKISEVELSLPKPSYTIDTLRALEKEYPEIEFSIIMGADNLMGLNRWKEAETLLSRYRIIVYPRPGYEAKEPEGAHIEIVDAPQVDISSTQLRRWIGEGRSVLYFTNDKVIEYFSQNNLYNKK